MAEEAAAPADDDKLETEAPADAPGSGAGDSVVEAAPSPPVTSGFVLLPPRLCRKAPGCGHQGTWNANPSLHTPGREPTLIMRGQVSRVRGAERGSPFLT